MSRVRFTYSTRALVFIGAVQVSTEAALGST